jgi:dienelactone hydrolase
VTVTERGTGAPLPSSDASTAAYHLAAVSGIDFLQSTANPYRADSDTGRVGVAGWSLGARSLTRTQEEDRRVDALVAWDNLAVRESGDEGSPACTFTGTAVRTPRVPALGQASETCPGEPSDVKLRAFEHWRAAGVATMQVVFRDATHFWWGGPGTEAQRELSHAYTRAWFDRWLKADSTMTVALLGPTVPFTGAAAASVLSPRFRSAAAFDGRRCTDLRVGC